MSQKDDSLPKLLNFELAKLAKNLHKTSSCANFCEVGLIALSVCNAENYMQRVKSTLKQVL